MSANLPKLYLARHGDTAWTDSHQHTGRTDLPLNERGEQHARQLGAWLRPFSFTRVFTSPLLRASKTCELAGFPLTQPSPPSDGGEGWVRGAGAEVDPDLIEWDYGRFEGKLTSDILKERPGWELFRDGCPDGEAPGDVAARANRFLARVHGLAGDVLAFSSGHIIRMIAARWLGLPPAAGRVFFCDPASVGVLGFEHDHREQPVLRLWNFVIQPPHPTLSPSEGERVG
jgi:probable phosphoglycerate mutase